MGNKKFSKKRKQRFNAWRSEKVGRFIRSKKKEGAKRLLAGLTARLSMSLTDVNTSVIKNIIEQTKRQPLSYSSTYMLTHHGSTFIDSTISTAKSDSSGHASTFASDTYNRRSLVSSQLNILAVGALTRQNRMDLELLANLRSQQNSHSYVRMLTGRSKLPAYQMHDSIVDAVQWNPVVVISGEAGCGKTTQIPQLILEHEISRGVGSVTRILVTEPRRINVISAAERVAAERGESVGRTVGYQVRLERCLPRRHQGSITYVTTETLLTWLYSDPLITSVSHIILDEVQEREYLCDSLLNILHRIMSLRSELRVVLLTTPFSADGFCDYFNFCPKIEIPSQLFSVEAFFLEDVIRLTDFRLSRSALANLLNVQKAILKRQLVDGGAPRRSATRTVASQNMKLDNWLRNQPNLSPMAVKILQVLNDGPYPLPDLTAHLVNHILNTTTSGAVLVFVPTVELIQETIGTLRVLNLDLYDEISERVRIYALHSDVNLSHQQGLFERPPTGQRKLIISTEVAETCLTIEDVVFVIDSGRANLNYYNAKKNTKFSMPSLICKVNAVQRRSRAGGIQPGKCFHLYSKFVFDDVMRSDLPPELIRLRLDGVFLLAKFLGLNPLSDFLVSYLTKPKIKAVERSLKFLGQIRALAGVLDNSQSDNGSALSLPPSTDHTCSQVLAEADRNDNWPGDSIGRSRPTIQKFYGRIAGDGNPLTSLGSLVARIPMDPQLAKLVLFGAIFGCLEPALAAASCLSHTNLFEVPIEKKASALKGRLELAQNTLSDHWVFVTLIQNYQFLKSSSMKQQFCQEYFIREQAVQEIIALMTDVAAILCDLHFIGSPNPNDEDANVNKDNVALFRAILFGSFYPNILKVDPVYKDGQLTEPLVTPRPDEGNVLISRDSVNANVWPTSPVCVTYFKKTMLNISFKPIILETTVIPMRSVLFFSGPTPPKHVSGNIYTLDGWIPVVADMSPFSMLLNFQRCLNDLLEFKFQNPSPTKWDPRSTECVLLKYVVDLLSSEPLPAVETQPYDWEQADVVEPVDSSSEDETF